MKANGSLTCAKDFSRALASPSQAEAHAHWKKLCSDTLLLSKAPVWDSKPPLLFPGPDPAAAPAGLSVFLAICQGRFVSQKTTYTGFEWALTPNLSDAHIFMSSSTAWDGLRSTMPYIAKGDASPDCSVLPLRGLFGAPLSSQGANIDPLSCALARAGARADLEAESLPVGTARRKPKTL